MNGIKIYFEMKRNGYFFDNIQRLFYFVVKYFMKIFIN